MTSMAIKLRLTVINTTLGTTSHHVGSEAEINNLVTRLSDPTPSTLCTKRTADGYCGCSTKLVVEELKN